MLTTQRLNDRWQLVRPANVQNHDVGLSGGRSGQRGEGRSFDVHDVHRGFADQSLELAVLRRNERDCYHRLNPRLRPADFSDSKTYLTESVSGLGSAPPMTRPAFWPERRETQPGTRRPRPSLGTVDRWGSKRKAPRN